MDVDDRVSASELRRFDAEVVPEQLPTAPVARSMRAHRGERVETR